MIHFTPEVEINFFRIGMLPILLNVLMWSNRKGVNVQITAIRDGGTSELRADDSGEWPDLVIEMVVDSGRRDDLDNLWNYMSQLMPYEFAVSKGSVGMRVTHYVSRRTR